MQVTLYHKYTCNDMINKVITLFGHAKHFSNTFIVLQSAFAHFHCMMHRVTGMWPIMRFPQATHTMHISKGKQVRDLILLRLLQPSN